MSTIPFGSRVAVWSVLVTIGLPVGANPPRKTVTVPPIVLVAPPLLNAPPDALVVLPPAVPPDALVVLPPVVPPDTLVVLPPAAPPDALVVLPPPVPPTLPPRPDGTPPLPGPFLIGVCVQAANNAATAMVTHPRWCFMPDRLSDHPSPGHGEHSRYKRHFAFTELHPHT
jgi:hypothetical protein